MAFSTPETSQQPQFSFPVESHEIDVLRHIQTNNRAKQRDIARAIGLSLGMTNSILKRLASKGFLVMRRLNSRNISYLVTPAGVELIARRSYRYLRRTVGTIVRYRDRIFSLVKDASRSVPRGSAPATVMLIGESDLAFLLEWCAAKCDMSFRLSITMPDVTPPSTLVIVSESVPAPGGDDPVGGPIYLARVLADEE